MCAMNCAKAVKRTCGDTEADLIVEHVFCYSLSIVGTKVGYGRAGFSFFLMPGFIRGSFLALDFVFSAKSHLSYAIVRYIGRV